MKLNRCYSQAVEVAPSVGYEDLLLDFVYMNKLNEIAAEFSEMLASFETYTEIIDTIKKQGGVTKSIEVMFGENFSSSASMEAEAEENASKANEGLWEKIKTWLSTAWEWIKNLFTSNEKIAAQLDELISKLQSGAVKPNFPITVKRPKYIQNQIDEATKPPTAEGGENQQQAPVKEAEDFVIKDVQGAVNECKFVKDALEKIKTIGDGVKNLEEEYKAKEGNDPGFFKKASMYMKTWATKQFVMSATRAYATRLQKLLAGEVQQGEPGVINNGNQQITWNDATKQFTDKKIIDEIKENPDLSPALLKQKNGDTFTIVTAIVNKKTNDVVRQLKSLKGSKLDPQLEQKFGDKDLIVINITDFGDGKAGGSAGGAAATDTKVLEDSLSKVVDLVKDKVKTITDTCQAELKSLNVIAPAKNPEDRVVNVPKCVGMNNAKFENFNSAVNILNAVSKYAEKQFFALTKGNVSAADAQKMQGESNEMERFVNEFSEKVMQKIQERTGKKGNEPAPADNTKGGKPAEPAAKPGEQNKPNTPNQNNPQVDYEDEQAAANALGEAAKKQQEANKKKPTPMDQQLAPIVQSLTQTNTKINATVKKVEDCLKNTKRGEGAQLVGRNAGKSIPVPTALGGGTFNPKTIGDVLSKLRDLSQRIGGIVSSASAEIKKAEGDEKTAKAMLNQVKTNAPEITGFYNKIRALADNCVADFNRTPAAKEEAPEKKPGLIRRGIDKIKGFFGGKKTTAEGEFSFEDFSLEELALYNNFIADETSIIVSELEAEGYTELSDDDFWK